MEKYLVVCNAYPSESNIYRNGFIHRRVKAYMEKGAEVEVFYLHPPATKEEKYTYDGVEVTLGNTDNYVDFIQKVGNEYNAFLIHFITPQMYYPIVENVKDPKLVVWIHGFEAEAWHRRWFNFLTSVHELKKVIEMAEDHYVDQLNFMHDLYKEDKYDITFIHVSQWFKDHIADVDAKYAPSNYEIIPNIVDDNVFTYEPSERSDKLRVLSIRPFASHKYANDQTAKAINILSKKPFFNDIEFHIYGKGKLFASITKSIKNHPNVHLHNTFLEQQEIAKLHKEFDVFLCPTRLDSQGVSMCEAMSSGLVPVATDITAIPEYVENNVSGLLAKPESPESIAYQIERLYFNRNLLEKLSYNAQKSIREKAGTEVVIEKEMKVMRNER
ncbi:glycosyltransferase family 4 protein [Staphylococcus massiliensis]|uniref:Glycosyl transferase family 1 domain-containing protein n=1 Tax=Staphylococcus massiliensis S46 TaxID=1229783 RepID=K9B1Z2_9STAP|nr:glycosyltransferase family 4 protein [Staphylococcus massiliensis]EKU47780.1 hypothetical protein C273_07047 [Staphylococcus massiliensis S46]MCG3399807.1 glycosyltransferase family 4 protein [Staphylococcus massiliensis]PNZ98032.1 hypothetical protein CD133_09570 [Staphylococcus massiliensis CCUG 55927]